MFVTGGRPGHSGPRKNRLLLTTVVASDLRLVSCSRRPFVRCADCQSKPDSPNQHCACCGRELAREAASAELPAIAETPRDAAGPCRVCGASIPEGEFCAGCLGSFSEWVCAEPAIAPEAAAAPPPVLKTPPVDSLWSELMNTPAPPDWIDPDPSPKQTVRPPAVADTLPLHARRAAPVCTGRARCHPARRCSYRTDQDGAREEPIASADPGQDAGIACQGRFEADSRFESSACGGAFAIARPADDVCCRCGPGRGPCWRLLDQGARLVFARTARGDRGGARTGARASARFANGDAEGDASQDGSGRSAEAYQDASLFDVRRRRVDRRRRLRSRARQVRLRPSPFLPPRCPCLLRRLRSSKLPGQPPRRRRRRQRRKVPSSSRPTSTKRLGSRCASSPPCPMICEPGRATRSSSSECSSHTAAFRRASACCGDRRPARGWMTP